MRSSLILGAVGLLIVAVMTGLWHQNFFMVFGVTRTLTDSEVPAAERALYERAAMQFVETLLADKPAEAHAQLVDELKEKVSVQQLKQLVDRMVLSLRPLSGLHVEHSFRVSQQTIGRGQRRVLATLQAGGNTSTPEGRVSLNVSPIPLQAHVIIEASARNNRLGFILWLYSGEPNWRVAGVHILPVTVLNRSATDIWKLARQENQRGHALNAYVLYATATQLAFRGPNLQLGILEEIDSEMKRMAKPAEFDGNPPFEWKFGKDTYKVMTVGPIGVGGVFDLNIVHQVAQTNDDKALEQQNRALIKAFEAAHPEYSDVFDGLVLRAVRPDGRGFGTVEQKRKAK
jgi:hypothetical protein